MVYGAAPQKAWGAMHAMLHDESLRSHWRRTLRVRGPKDGHYGQPRGRGHVHGAGIIADEQMARGETRGQFSDARLSRQVDGAMAHGGDNGLNQLVLRGNAEKYHIRMKPFN